MMSHFDYHQPVTLPEAITLLDEHGREAALLAGGTALLIDIRHGELAPRHVVSLWGIPGLEDIQVDGYPGYRFGSLVTITNLANALVANRLYGDWSKRHAARRASGAERRHPGRQYLQSLPRRGHGAAAALPGCHAGAGGARWAAPDAAGRFSHRSRPDRPTPR